MITKQQFDKLLGMVMIDLKDQEYERVYHQMDSIMSFIDILNEVSFDTLEGDSHKNVVGTVSIVDRDYPHQSIDLSWSHHPLINNMIQLKFKQG